MRLEPILLYTLIPVAAAIIGGAIAVYRRPAAWVQSMIQHLAAGVVFAAVAGELLPDVTKSGAIAPVVVGFVLGVALMLGLRQALEGLERKGSSASRLPTGLIAAVGIDLLIDGLLVGVGFAVGADTGVLLSIAMTLEVVFLGMTTAAELSESGARRAQSIGVVTGLAVLVVVGALLGAMVVAGMSGDVLIAVLSFGVAALLFLVTEELLVEAHEVPETPLATAMFFVGFLALEVIEMLA